METRPIKRALVQLITALVLCCLLFLGYCAFANHQGEEHARAACSAVPVGTTFDQVREVASRASGDAHLYRESASFIGVGFKGALVERWYCNFRFADGRLVEREVRFLD